ncbi:hypothetical protein LJR143_001437 [Pseudoxanthomonas sp. LjRoot143]|uniref:hypothetical protein n=1 Tax=Pseudoxanthomonas sp. LjRoot143 TaxID=3342266 RepID=UPI003ED081D9
MTYPAPKLPIIVSWTSLLLAAAGAHLALALLLPEQKWVTPLGVSLAVAVAAAFCLAQAKRRTELLRLRWCLLAAGMALWILAYGLSAYSQMSNADTAVASPYLMVFSLRAIPWLLAIVLMSNRKSWPIPACLMGYRRCCLSSRSACCTSPRSPPGRRLPSRLSAVSAPTRTTNW